jgi:antitoxin component YwqK of YwqJK toxin-antitoxin module
MVQKAPLHFKLIIVLVCFVGCKNKSVEALSASAVFVASAAIPTDTISSTDVNLKLDNGTYYFDQKPFKGYIKSGYSESKVKSVESYLDGKQHAVSIFYYLNGSIKDKRSYKNGKSFGKQLGFWENGHQKYVFFYNNDKREGVNQQWYESGERYCSLTFKDDKEDGMQKAWRENGKIYINYEVKNGARYGLQKSALCYTLIDQKLKSK